MRQIGYSILALCVAFSSGCHVCFWGKRYSEFTSPTDIRKTHPWCLGEDALFHYPCGPNRANYGLKQTEWRDWGDAGTCYSEGSYIPPDGSTVPLREGLPSPSAPGEHSPTFQPEKPNPFRDEESQLRTPAAAAAGPMSLPSPRASNWTERDDRAPWVGTASAAASAARTRVATGSGEVRRLGDERVEQPGELKRTPGGEEAAIRVSVPYFPPPPELESAAESSRVSYVAPKTPPSTPPAQSAIKFAATARPPAPASGAAATMGGRGVLQVTDSARVFANPYMPAASVHQDQVQRRECSPRPSAPAAAAESQQDDAQALAAPKEALPKDASDNRDATAKKAKDGEATLAALESSISAGVPDQSVILVSDEEDAERQEETTLAALKTLISEGADSPPDR